LSAAPNQLNPNRSPIFAIGEGFGFILYVSDKLKVFEDKHVRHEWSENEQDWYLSIVDVVELLTGTDNPRRYWSDLKRKLKSEGSQLYESIVQLKMQATDGKYYKTDVANTKEVLRLVM